MKKLLSIACVLLLLSACKDKKLVIMSKGPAEVNTEAKTIKAKDGSGHEEKEIIMSSSDVTYKITAPAGESTVDLPGDGLYIINAKVDTIVGGYQEFLDPKEAQKAITQEVLKHRIDSMILLSEGKNASAANRSFYILPNKAVRISDNTQSTVIGPYHRMRSVEKVDGKQPEVYHFYSLKEFREKIAEMVALTVGEKI